MAATAETEATTQANAAFWQSEYDRIQARTRGPWQWWQTNRYEIDAHLLDSNAVVWPTDLDPLDVVYRRTRALLGELKSLPSAADLADLEVRLEGIKRRMSDPPRAKDAAITESQQRLFTELMGLNRQIALRNPLLDFEAILFVSRDDGHPGIIQANRKTTIPAGCRTAASRSSRNGGN